MPTATKRQPSALSRVANSVREQIHSGRFKPGDKLPSYSEMVAEYGVSMVTVDRIYNHLEQEGLIVRQQGRGTFVAEPKATARKNAIALCVPMPRTQNASPAYWTELREGVSEVLQREGIALTVIDDLAPGLADRCDGMLHASYQSLEKVRGFVPGNFPLVSVIVPQEGMVSVLSDDADGVRQSVEYLLQLGHRRIAFMAQGSDLELELWRINGYQNALAQAGIDIPENWMRRGSGRTVNNFLVWGRAMMTQWLQEDWLTLGCTALVTQNDEMAVGAMQALQENGIDIPGQVSVVGFDSTTWCDFVSPTLTSVEIPLHDMGKLAAELLLKKIRGEDLASEHEENGSVFLPTRLVIRRSTRGPL